MSSNRPSNLEGHLSSDELFFSSPPGNLRPIGPIEEVLLLTTRAQETGSLNPTLTAFLSQPTQKSLFFETFARHVELLKSRSQAFEDAHVTVYDKVLLNLTRNGNNLENPQAIAYFCEEFLAINPLSDPEHQRGILQQSVTLSSLLNQGAVIPSQEWWRPQLTFLEVMSPPRSKRDSTGSSKLQNSVEHPSQESRETQYETTGSNQAKQPSSERIKSESVQRDIPSRNVLVSELGEIYPQPNLNDAKLLMEPKLARLWAVYEKARGDFKALSNSNNPARLSEAARFLRDTAENTLEYLRNKNTDPIMMAELKATYEMAKTTAVSLTGGRKRKFDIVEMNEIKGTPREPSNLPSTAMKRTRHGRGRVMLGACKERDEATRQSGSRQAGRGFAGGQPGRGHSGIPFGYSRQVDSYQPY